MLYINLMIKFALNQNYCQMKKSVVICVMVMLAVMGVHGSTKPMNDIDRQRLTEAVKMMDSGSADVALITLDDLSELYPEDYVVMYERLVALSMLDEYDMVIKGAKKLIKHPDVNYLLYQLYGNAYDCAGKPKEAKKIYEQGLKRFPNAGALWLELGNLSLLKNEYNEALNCYNKGIEVEPNFASNYYRAAQLYLDSTEPVMGLIYGETEILLSPGGTNRRNELSRKMVECYEKNIKIDGDTTSITFTQNIPYILVSKEPQITVLCAFSGIYEGCAAAAAISMCANGDCPPPHSIKFLIEFRKSLVETYIERGEELFGESMYLFQYLNKMLASAGVWEAYNYWLFGSVYTEDFAEWIKQDGNAAKLQAMGKWFEDNGFVLGDGRSVGYLSLYTHGKPLTVAEASAKYQSLLAVPEGINDHDQTETSK